MTKRLQILLSESEFEQLKFSALAGNVSVGEWVRRAIRQSLADPAEQLTDAKLLAVKEAVGHLGPTGEIQQLNRETEMGYLSGLP